MGSTEPDFLGTINQYEFAYFGPNMQTAIKVKFPLVEFDKMPSMTDAQYRSLRDHNSRAYAYSHRPPRRPSAPVALDLAAARAALEQAIKDHDWARAGELQHSIIPDLERRAASAGFSGLKKELPPEPQSPNPVVAGIHEEGGTDWRR